MPRSPSLLPIGSRILPKLPASAELVGLTFGLSALASSALYPQYTIGLHAWFLDQIRQFDAALSAQMHDGEEEKPFTVSGLNGLFTPHSRQLYLQAGERYEWQITALSKPVVQGLATWLKQLPDELALRNAPLAIQSVELVLPPVTYAKLWQQAADLDSALSLTFTSPTSFRRKGHHFPLPVPTNLFHSYLRRWNNFAKRTFEPEPFLAWVEEHVIIQRHRLESAKVAAGKQGSVTGFTGSISLALDRQAEAQPEFRQLFYALGLLAEYCGTGHKTTFGLGQTHWGWQSEPETSTAPTTPLEMLLADRIAELTAIFLAQRKRTGGDRAVDIAETWSTILARRELGESLQTIAQDLEMPYETVKTYVKLARRSLQQS